MVSQFEVQALHCHCEAPLGAVVIQGGKTTLHGLGPPRFAWDAEAGASTFQTGTLPTSALPCEACNAVAGQGRRASPSLPWMAPALDGHAERRRATTDRAAGQGIPLTGMIRAT